MNVKISLPIVAVLIVLVAGGGMFFRYGSLKPCDWYIHDLTAKSGVPKFLMSALVKARNEVQKLGTKECLENWVDLHFNGAESQLGK